jgi:hypothetical protein
MTKPSARIRRGVSIIPTIAFYAVAMTLMAIWVKGAVREQRQVTRWHERSQTAFLAEAGLHRAVARLNQEGISYTGEQWHVSKSDIESSYDAIVDIQVTPVTSNDDEGTELVRVITIADYPAGTERRIRVTKETVLDLNTTRQPGLGE